IRFIADFEINVVKIINLLNYFSHHFQLPAYQFLMFKQMKLVVRDVFSTINIVDRVQWRVQPEFGIINGGKKYDFNNHSFFIRFCAEVFQPMEISFVPSIEVEFVASAFISPYITSGPRGNKPA